MRCDATLLLLMLHAPLATHFKEAIAAYHCPLRYQKQSTQQVDWHQNSAN
jgi:hypothetical protein